MRSARSNTPTRWAGIGPRWPDTLGDQARRAAYESIFGRTPLDPQVLPKADPKGTPRREAAWAGLDDASRLEIDRVAANVGKAMAAYQRTLTGGETRFDRWVSAVRAGGDPEGLLAIGASRNEAVLRRAECWECHAGPLFSDGEFHNIGTPVADRLPRDPGRYDGGPRGRGPVQCGGVHSDDPEGDQAIVSRGVKRDPGQWGAFRTPSFAAWRRPRRTCTTVRCRISRQWSVLLDPGGGDPAGSPSGVVLSVLNLSPEESDDLVAFLATLDPIERPETIVP